MMAGLIALITAIALTLTSTHAQSGNRACRSDEEIRNTLFANYSKLALPGNIPVKTTVELWIQDIYNVDHEDKDVEFDVFLSQMWKDDRLEFTTMTPCNTNVTLLTDEQLWLPNMNFVSSKKAEILKSPLPNTFALIFENGTVWTNYRMRVKIPCVFEEKRYPFDKVECKVSYESYRFSVATVDASWVEGKDPVMVLGTKSLTRYHISNHTTEQQTNTYPAGRWSELSFTIVFTRKFGSVMVSSYVPAILAVVAAGITFFLGKKSTIARTVMATCAFFFLIFLLKEIGIFAEHSIKMIDVYILVGLAFVLSALVEVALANGCSNTGASYQFVGDRNGFESLPGGAKETGMHRPQFFRRHCGKFDLSAGVLYFLLFAIWNIIYFLVIAVL